MKTIILSVYNWLQYEDECLADIAHEIKRVIGNKSTGCFLVKLGGHEEAEKEPGGPYWIPMVENNAKRISEALGTEVAPKTEEEARITYLEWCTKTGYQFVGKTQISA
jgi:hypothetical protein